MEGLRAPKVFTERLRGLEPRSTRCLNCGAEMAGPFCAQCGQRDIPPYPSLGELVTDAFWELSGWDGRFAGTVRALLQTPGRLTREFLEGRRARYISPLRLYLFASLMYFLAAAAAPDVRPTDGSRISAPGLQLSTETGAGRVSAAGLKAREGSLTPAQRDTALAEIANAPAVLRPILRRLVADSQGFKKSLLATMPRVLFALVPIFAAILALFYHGRKYPEHLYFGLHLHAFFFVALTVAALSKFSNSVAFSIAASLIVSIWIAAYSLVSARRVYGGSWAATLAKGVGVTVLYSMAGVLGLCVAIYWAALSR
jgi:hypothetical protein